MPPSTARLLLYDLLQHSKQLPPQLLCLIRVLQACTKHELPTNYG